MIVANMATYPKRKHIIEESVKRLLPQVDILNLCLNEYEKIPNELLKYKKLNAFIPEHDYKDMGKFVPNVHKDDYVFLIDDDIIYPENYVSVLLNTYKKYEHLNIVLGVHGIIYSDLQTSDQKLRTVFHFTKHLDKNRVVNQLGTGTVCLKGRQMPDLSFMIGSEKFVDVRFALYLHSNHVSSICIKRNSNWMQELKQEESIWQTFTQGWSVDVTREAQKIAGYSKLNFNVVATVEGLKDA